MKKLFFYSCCSTLILLVGCLKMPSVKITDSYIEIIKPGERFGLVEVKALMIDSTFGYPATEREVVAYSIVDRNTHKRLSPNASLKMYFKIKNDRYCWQVSPDLFSAEVYYTDTLNLKPYTWYRASTEKYHFSVYFFLDKVKGSYLSLLKPDPGAW